MTTADLVRVKEAASGVALWRTILQLVVTVLSSFTLWFMSQMTHEMAKVHAELLSVHDEIGTLRAQQIAQLNADLAVSKEDRKDLHERVGRLEARVFHMNGEH